MRFAYADPPYIGQAKKHYGKEESYGGEVDHHDLIAHLFFAFPDGWALSASSPSLEEILHICRSVRPNAVRVSPWVKPFGIFKPGVNPAYVWEPVVWFGGRKRPRTAPTTRDWVQVGEDLVHGTPDVHDWVSSNITLKKGLSGVKPDKFSFWLFDLLGMEPEDEFIDLFPGSGAVTRAWEAYVAERSGAEERIAA